MKSEKGLTILLVEQNADAALNAADYVYIMHEGTIDTLVKSLKTPFPVIPAEAGIHLYQMLAACLDPGFRRGDDFLRTYHY